ncbi:YlxM family DNA-binding protein [Mahella australiensis]|uniref:UPF0122 protein Mahau_1055 n=1 Tax=Mahella australiensis (strain DSM 15567 / CIP 107919 / 50-1 BON) TaxID=697281 RepID=F4A2S3_MAHA5|nr:YlxM family DNA-binding protein [Mahella australiensis]AEE96253.1 helix-turn-helix protein YlxM/p13 family protein [Mahella australiensis 50-1 BON]
MDRIAEVGLLLDLYGSILTDKERNMLDLHYNYDLSLAEIAEQMGVTRQAVHDNIKRGEAQLYELDSKLHLLEQHMKQKKYLDDILAQMDIMQCRLDDMRALIKTLSDERG